MKYAYTVKGSEDGILGVYSSAKKAHQAAIDYLVNGGAYASDIESYKTKWYANYEANAGGVYSEVEKWRVE